MQAIKTKKSFRKKTLFIAVALFILVAGAGVFAYTQNLGPFASSEAEPTDQEINYNEPTEEQVEAGEQTKEEVVNEATKPATSNSSVGSTPSKTVEIEFTSGPNVTNGTFSVRALIQELNTSGSCTLTLSKAGQPNVAKTAKTQPLANASTCQGFDFDVSGLQEGTWNVELSYKSSSASGKINESVTL